MGGLGSWWPADQLPDICMSICPRPGKRRAFKKLSDSTSVLVLNDRPAVPRMRMTGITSQCSCRQRRVAAVGFGGTGLLGPSAPGGGGGGGPFIAPGGGGGGGGAPGTPFIGGGGGGGGGGGPEPGVRAGRTLLATSREFFHSRKEGSTYVK